MDLLDEGHYENVFCQSASVAVVILAKVAVFVFALLGKREIPLIKEEPACDQANAHVQEQQVGPPR